MFSTRFESHVGYFSIQLSILIRHLFSTQYNMYFTASRLYYFEGVRLNSLDSATEIPLDNKSGLDTFVYEVFYACFERNNRAEIGFIFAVTPPEIMWTGPPVRITVCGLLETKPEEIQKRLLDV